VTWMPTKVIARESTVDSNVDTDNALGEEAKSFIANNNMIK
ncbi:10687_t:CDS:2, partial [Racocetra persica]